VRKILAYTSDDPLAALWVLLLTSGLRRAEALRLAWSDVDLDAGRINVRQTLASVGTEAVLSEPKTAKSRRLVVLARVTVVALRSHRARQAEELLAVGVGYSDGGLVFTHVEGSPLNPANVVAEVLGHSSTQVTLDVYSHVTPSMQSDATSRVANLLTGASKRS
jgi:integrase